MIPGIEEGRNRKFDLCVLCLNLSLRTYYKNLYMCGIKNKSISVLSTTEKALSVAGHVYMCWPKNNGLSQPPVVCCKSSNVC